MKLSIIIPVYGVEAYIEEFLNELIPQLIEDVELIFINDGTKDKSIDIVKCYKDKLATNLCNNLLIFHQENQGQSIARNFGINKAQGEYIGFLDPDDYVQKDYIETVLKMLKNNPDILNFGARAFLDRSNIFVREIYTTLTEGLYKATQENLIEIYSECAWMPWLRIIKREVIIYEFFPEKLLLEDVYLFTMLYLKVDTIYHCNKILVNYRIREGSSIGQKSSYFFNSYCNVIKYLVEKREVNPLLIDMTLNQLSKNLFQESINSRGFKFAISFYQLYPKSMEFLNFILYRSLVYFFKKIMGVKI
ncbi:glycosyltransferase family 2 protein [Acinetobacter kanungonis]|uniref:glycosyltransferase family 2 protein n=1 Tax=Acinetobacter kanungonis TaxID=2699469 RepID=UPI00137A6FF3|nr:glycosyltransferase [Acinetobacter kanungonis]NCI79691.1 glycosyltransferase [Acinetobacter kanungonis]